MLICRALVYFVVLLCLGAGAQAQGLTGFSFGLAGVDEQAVSVKQQTDGHIYLGGSTGSGQIGGSDLTLSKVSATGNHVLWTREYGTTANDYSQYLNTAGPNALIMAGVTYPDATGMGLPNAVLIKTDTAGAVQFYKTFGQVATSESFSYVEQTSDNGYIACGFISNTFANGEANDAWVVKFDSQGDIQWQIPLGGLLNDYAQEVHQTQDGGYIVAVDSKSFNIFGAYDCVAYKLDAAGSEEWATIAGGEFFDTGNQGLIVTAAGDYIMFGEASTGTSPGYDVTVAKVHRNGQLLWNIYIPGPGTEAAFSAAEMSNGHLLLTGYSNAHTNGLQPTDIFLLETDSGAAPIHTDYFGGPGVDLAYDIQHSPFGGFLISGATQINGNSDYQLLYHNYTGPLQQPALVSSSVRELHVFPNPVSGSQRVNFTLPAGSFTWQLLDLFGRTMQSGESKSGETTLKMPSGLPAGVYVIQAIQAGVTYTQKLTLLR